MNHAFAAHSRMTNIRAAIRPFVHVARTYRRRRFLVFGGCYLLTVVWWHTSAAPAMQCVVSANFASVLCCFMALHLRRQFGSAASGVVPGFAIPHLVVGGVLSLFVWAVLPGVEAALTGMSPPATVAVHAVAAIFLALTVWQPKAIVLLAFSPVAVEIVAGSGWASGRTFLVRFLFGEDPHVSALLIGLGILAYPLAAFRLIRLGGQSASFSDDIAIEQPISDGPTGWWSNLILARRDEAVEERLARGNRRGWTVERWRIPGAIARIQLVVGVALVFALMAAAWAVSMGSLGAAWFAMALSCGLMLLAPFTTWHWRRNWLGWEMLRPVTRPQYFRQLAAALARDVLVWTALASTISLVVNVLLFARFSWQPASVDYRVFLLIGPAQILQTAGAGVLLFGLSLITLRRRYWLPLMVGLGVAWSYLMLFVVGLMIGFLHDHGYSEWAILPCAFLAALAAAMLGLLLAAVAYRRALEADLD